MSCHEEFKGAHPMRVSACTLRPGDLMLHRFARWGMPAVCVVISTRRSHDYHTVGWPDFSGTTRVRDMYGETHSISHFNWEGAVNTVELLSRAGDS